MQNLSTESQIRAHVFIFGKVQGVGYRFSTVNEARRLGVNGWVRNLLDKRVEAVFQGSQANVEQMIGWCHQGPPGAVVEEVVVEYEMLEELQGFEIVR